MGVVGEICKFEKVTLYTVNYIIKIQGLSNFSCPVSFALMYGCNINGLFAICQNFASNSQFCIPCFLIIKPFSIENTSTFSYWFHALSTQQSSSLSNFHLHVISLQDEHRKQKTLMIEMDHWPTQRKKLFSSSSNIRTSTLQQDINNTNKELIRWLWTTCRHYNCTFYAIAVIQADKRRHIRIAQNPNLTNCPSKA